ncbi:MAG TPA: hypothetical protein VN316_02425 [candidate division Zixibacteria bacterium]|nr:hypothetical protein [candidate division Zixibacteria bacterium]
MDIDIEFEQEVADFYQSIGISTGPGDIQYRLILLVLAKNGEENVTRFSEIRDYTDKIADRGSIGSKIKTVFQLEGLAIKVGHGGYSITHKGLLAADFIQATSVYYKKIKSVEQIIERIPS